MGILKMFERDGGTTQRHAVEIPHLPMDVAIPPLRSSYVFTRAASARQAPATATGGHPDSPFRRDFLALGGDGGVRRRLISTRPAMRQVSAAC